MAILASKETRLLVQGLGRMGRFHAGLSREYGTRVVGGVDTPHSAHGVAMSGSIAYVADLSAGLQVVDVADPASPTIVGSVDTPGQARRVEVSGGTAYVADGGRGLQVVDVSNPAYPLIVASVDMPGEAYDVAVSWRAADLVAIGCPPDLAAELGPVLVGTGEARPPRTIKVASTVIPGLDPIGDDVG